MEETEKSGNKNGLVVALIVGSIILFVGVLYSAVLLKKADVNTTVTETEMVVESDIEEAVTPYTRTDDEGEVRVDPDIIKSIILRKDGDDGYRFELYVDDEEVYFTCWYPTSKGDIRCDKEQVNSSRLSDITDILEKYTVSATIRQYRNSPGEVAIEGDDSQALEIRWLDGDFVNLGFPNGAGPALEKYFINLANWLGSKK